MNITITSEIREQLLTILGTLFQKKYLGIDKADYFNIYIFGIIMIPILKIGIIGQSYMRMRVIRARE